MNRESYNPVPLMEAFARLSKADWRKTTKWGIKASEVRVLLAIADLQFREEGKSTTVSELSKKLEVTSPTITQMVNSLIKGGYLLRSIHPTDRRISEITLTELGTDIARKAMTEYRAVFAGLTDHLGQEQSEQLTSLLNQAYAYFREVSKKNQP